MKKFICLVACFFAMTMCLVGCSSKNNNYSGYATEIWYTCDDSYSIEAYSRKIENAYFEYINDNTIKITDSNGNVIIIDSSNLEIIKVDTSK